jgi:hypothetical protein
MASFYVYDIANTKWALERFRGRPFRFLIVFVDKIPETGESRSQSVTRTHSGHLQGI